MGVFPIAPPEHMHESEEEGHVHVVVHRHLPVHPLVAHHSDHHPATVDHDEGPVLTLSSVYKIPSTVVILGPTRTVTAHVEPPQPQRLERSPADVEHPDSRSASSADSDSAPRLPFPPRNAALRAAVSIFLCLEGVVCGHARGAWLRRWSVCPGWPRPKPFFPKPTRSRVCPPTARAFARFARRGRRARGGARRRPVAESASHVQSRIGGRRDREHVPGDAAAARSPDDADFDVERGVRAGRGQRAAGRRRGSAGSRGAAARRTPTSSSAQVREAEIVASRDRLRGLADILGAARGGR